MVVRVWHMLLSGGWKSLTFNDMGLLQRCVYIYGVVSLYTTATKWLNPIRDQRPTEYCSRHFYYCIRKHRSDVFSDVQRPAHFHPARSQGSRQTSPQLAPVEVMHGTSLWTLSKMGVPSVQPQGSGFLVLALDCLLLRLGPWFLDLAPGSTSEFPALVPNTWFLVS